MPSDDRAVDGETLEALQSATSSEPVTCKHCGATDQWVPLLLCCDAASDDWVSSMLWAPFDSADRGVLRDDDGDED